MEEYAKQISAVFLSLLVLVFGLVVMSLERVPGDVQEAARQAAAVHDVVSSWDPGFLDSFASQVVSKATTQISRSHTPYEVEGKALQRRFALEFVDPSWTVQPLPADLKKFDQAYGDTQVRHYGFIQVENEYLRGRTALRPPATIGEFISLWDALQQDLGIFVPVDVARAALIHSVVGSEKNEWGVARPVTNNATTMSIRMLFRAPTEYEVQDPQRLFLKSPVLEGQEYTHIYTGALRIGQPNPLSDQREIELPVLTKRIASFNGQTALIRSTASPWHTGSFKDSFPELEAESKLLLNVSIPEATRILQYEAHRPTAQFEVFGVKIPTAKALTLGIPLLLALQFYLWAYLNAFSHRLVAETAFKDYAWIGFLDDVATIAITNVVVLLLPPSVLGILLFQEALSRRTMWLWILSVLLLCSSVRLAVASFQRLRSARSTLSSRRGNPIPPHTVEPSSPETKS